MKIESKRKDKCINCKGDDLQEIVIFRDEDIKKEKITYNCFDCRTMFTIEEVDY